MIDLKSPKTVVPPPSGLLSTFWANYKESLFLEGKLASELQQVKTQLEHTSALRQGIERLLLGLQDEEAAENGCSRRSHKPSSVGSTPTPATKKE